MAPRATATATDESNAAKFSRVASKRTGRAINALRGVRRTAGAGYEFTPEQADKIVQALAAEVKAIQSAFAGTVKASDEGFQV